MSGAVSMEKEIYTVDEVAALLRVHRTTVTNMIARGELKSFRVGREHRIRARELERLMEGQSSDPLDDSGEHPKT